MTDTGGSRPSDAARRALRAARERAGAEREGTAHGTAEGAVAPSPPRPSP
ncbi:hypothetical protein GT039_25265, partial [Streptomyces sp. SID2955]|nr:hypothetical protein [Streptomyces sp. SID2955]